MQALTAAPSAVAPQQSRPARSRALAVVARASSGEQPDRRATLLALGGLAAAALVPPPQAALAAPAYLSAATVKDYLPEAEGLPGFCTYTPDGKKTPAIRAGVIKPEPEFYSFAVPETWVEAPLLNPQTGNFCMPRCEEPWYEFKFEGKEGSAQLIVAELQKLGAKPGAKLEALGSPESVVSRVGNFITGTYLEEEDVQVAEKATGPDGRPYYVYEVFTAYSKTPSHNLAAVTAKGDLAYIFVATASEKQWGAGEGTLRKMLKSFKA